MAKGIFAPDSFWNQPISSDAQLYCESERLVNVLAQEPTGGFFINLDHYTIPVIEVDADTPAQAFSCRTFEGEPVDAWMQFHAWKDDLLRFGHGPEVGDAIRIPETAFADIASDAHMCLVDWKERRAWDMWAARKVSSGHWEACSAVTYSLDGDGFPNAADFPVVDNESIHFHGPCRASGLPLLAGLIMHDEVLAGKIEHKLVFACRFASFQEFIAPAIWTDGFYDKGVPEGILIQLDPNLDIERFDLLPGEKVVVKALQQYGAVCSDVAYGNVIYGELATPSSDFSWDGILSFEGLSKIPIECYRFIETYPVQQGGDRKRHPLKLDKV